MLPNNKKSTTKFSEHTGNITVQKRGYMLGPSYDEAGRYITTVIEGVPVLVILAVDKNRTGDYTLLSGSFYLVITVKDPYSHSKFLVGQHSRGPQGQRGTLQDQRGMSEEENHSGARHGGNKQDPAEHAAIADAGFAPLDLCNSSMALILACKHTRHC